jgi:TolA-binding protein
MKLNLFKIFAMLALTSNLALADTPSPTTASSGFNSTTTTNNKTGNSLNIGTSKTTNADGSVTLTTEKTIQNKTGDVSQVGKITTLSNGTATTITNTTDGKTGISSTSTSTSTKTGTSNSGAGPTNSAR